MTARLAMAWQISQDNCAPPDWEEFLATCPDGHFFATELWTRAVCRHWPRATPVWLTARLDDRLVGGMVAVHIQKGPLGRLVSHFEGTQGGPLVLADQQSTQQDALFLDLVEAYARLRRRFNLAVTLTLGAQREERFGHLLAGTVWQRQEIPTAIMPLAGGLKHVEMNVLKKNRRNERNRSLKWGCRYEVTCEPRDLDAYYPIYLAASHRWNIAPTPLGMLRQLLVEADGHAFLTVVRFQEQIIGGHLNFHWADRITAWNGATLPEHDDKFPATLLIWADLEEACQRGAHWLDLGGSGGRSKLSSFKRLLGAEVEVSGHYQLDSALVRAWHRSKQWFRRENEQKSAAVS